jgi:uncharacterized protein involved in exopolysaccharide biosynthesis
LLDLVVAIAKHKRLTVGVPLVLTLLSLAVVFLLPQWYLATAKIMPPQQTQSSATAILGQLGALTGGATQALGLKNPSDIYIAMLKSRTIADRLIDRFNLKDVYSEDLVADARKELASNTFVFSGREGVITIEVEDTDPKRAADIANAYVDELRELSARLAVSEASQRRLFFEEQLRKTKNDLADAEVELRVFAQKSGLVKPQEQLGLSVVAAATIRAQITAKEIQLTAMRSFATDANPELRRVIQELGGLRSELAKLESDSGAGKGDVTVPFGKAPELGLEYVRRLRNTKYYEILFEVLAKQYEIARIDEAKDAALIQVLDVAVAPERKSKPKRAAIVLSTFVLSAFLTILAALVLEIFRQSPLYAQRLAKLRELRALLSFGAR